MRCRGEADSFTYRPYGPASSFRYGNNAVRSRGYNQGYLPTSVLESGIQSLTLAYDTADRVTGISNGITSSLSQTYGYDELSRLKTVTSASGNQSWTFDANGNRTQHVWGGATDTYSPQTYNNRIPTITGTRAKSFTYRSGPAKSDSRISDVLL